MVSKRSLALVSTESHPQAAEFFAGIGLARLGLEASGVKVSWANDFDDVKASMYRTHFRDEVNHLVHGDIGKVTGDDIPDVDIAWSSFPCTDLSLAGNRKGLAGHASGTFWQFTRILDEMKDRRPPVVALENVVGFATSHGGDDLAAAIKSLNDLGYSVDVLTLDARRFVPQSRPRLFLVGALTPPKDVPDPNSELRPDWLQASYGDPTLVTHRAQLPAPPAPLTSGLKKVIDTTHDWWPVERTERFLESLSFVQDERLNILKIRRAWTYRTAYRRTRDGVARWEVRPDDISGCLRTARGGSSKQAVVRAGYGKVQVKWMTPTEYARLMGAPDFNLDGARNNQALFGFGDAVCVPAVTWLSKNYLIPLANGILNGQSSGDRVMNVV
ncbi:DNA cytosine methyltransferase [Rhodococcus sp. 1168]|uniref:DNA cytosine methyltransferase n=1 Tax=Rhodococcus sp. 1168 TaxID=2018041 RepID=UPI000A0ECB75|nr:DNA (cytosine-5-)-methyltransferase [Rhodococcus sp. 1168]ORI12831.1 DNA (cytosine-5-)-methyltransferase [Rhodococcus sp. 1168]